MLQCIECGDEQFEDDLILINDSHICINCSRKLPPLEFNNVYNMNCLDGMKLIKTETIDLILTDPPYGVSYNEKSKHLKLLGKSGQKQIERDKYYIEFGKSEGTLDYFQLAKQFYRVLKNNSHCYIFCGDKQITSWVPAIEKAGFKFVQLLIWYKNAPTFDLTMGHKFVEYKENVLFFQKGWKKLNSGNPYTSSSVLKFNRLNKCEIHPTERPQDLLQHLIKLSSNEGDVVLDAFAGSGAHLIAALSLNRKFIGFELSKHYYQEIMKRLNNYKSQKKLTHF